MISLKLKSGEEDRLLGGHRWIFSNELAEAPAEAEPGSLALLVSSRGKTLGVGFFNPKSLIAFRLLSREPASIDAAFIGDRLGACLERRRGYLGEQSSACRIAFGESDDLPGLVIDRFGDVLVLQILSAGMERLLDPLLEALKAVFSPTAVYLKNDHPARALEGLSGESRCLFGTMPDEIQISENGVRYVVDPVGGQKTGFYFDQRENRSALARLCSGKSVLDLYCHSGGFALNAAKNGALRVFGIDSSERAVSAAVKNAELNGLSDRVEFAAADADELLTVYQEARRRFMPDIVCVDPPSLVPAKKDLTRGLRALTRINANAFRMVPRGGIVATSSCSHHVSRSAFVSSLREAASKAQKTVRLIELRGQAVDHPVLLTMPETEYLHFALLEVW